MKVYVASSWRNAQQPEVVCVLREVGHEVYDYRNPKPGDTGFRWSDVALRNCESSGLCYPVALEASLKHPRAVEGFASDFGAMKWADACVLLLPSGRSAHLEAGWMAGAGKKTLIMAPLKELIEPELMYGLLGPLCVNIYEVLRVLKDGE